jgi:voltage-gated potassium channel Kch
MFGVGLHFLFFVSVGMLFDPSILVLEPIPVLATLLIILLGKSIVAADPEVIRSANLGKARCLLVAIPDAFEAGQVVQQAREISKDLPIIARARSKAEIDHLGQSRRQSRYCGRARDRQGHD